MTMAATIPGGRRWRIFLSLNTALPVDVILGIGRLSGQI